MVRDVTTLCTWRKVARPDSFEANMRKPIILVAAAALLAMAPAANAADYTGTVSPASPQFAWDGGPGTSVGANTGVIGGASVGNFVGCYDTLADCEETLLKVESPGTLTLTAESDAVNDTIDMYLYPSNASGEYDDAADDMAAGGGAGTTGNEKIVAKVKTGYYMVLIKFFLAPPPDGATYKGLAVLSGFPQPAAAPAAPAAPAPTTSTPPPSSSPAPSSQPQSQPAPAPKTSKKAACQKKAKKIKNKKKRAKALKKCKKVKG